MNEYWITFAMAFLCGYLAHMFSSAEEFLREWKRLRAAWRKLRAAQLEKHLIEITLVGSDQTQTLKMGSLGQEAAKNTIHFPFGEIQIRLPVRETTK